MSRHRISNRRARVRPSGSPLLVWMVVLLVIFVLMIVLIVNRPSTEIPKPQMTIRAEPKTTPTSMPAPVIRTKIPAFDDRFDKAYLWSSWAVMGPRGRMTRDGYRMADDGSKDEVGLIRHVGPGNLDARFSVRAIQFADKVDLIHQQVVSVGFWDTNSDGLVVDVVRDASGEAVLVRRLRGDEVPITHHKISLQEPCREIDVRMIWNNAALTWKVLVGINGEPVTAIPSGVIRVQTRAGTGRIARATVDQQGLSGEVAAAIRRFTIAP